MLLINEVSAKELARLWLQKLGQVDKELPTLEQHTKAAEAVLVELQVKPLVVYPT